jgi:hypothetical protein
VIYACPIAIDLAWLSFYQQTTHGGSRTPRDFRAAAVQPFVEEDINYEVEVLYRTKLIRLHRALLYRQTLALTCCRKPKRQRSVGFWPSGAALC